MLSYFVTENTEKNIEDMEEIVRQRTTFIQR